jgi:hypothetical protein
MNLNHTSSKFDVPGFVPDIDLEFILEIVKKHNPKTIIDVGCFLGRTSAYLRTHFPDAKILCIDTFKYNLDTTNYFSGDTTLIEQGLTHEEIFDIVAAEYNLQKLKGTSPWDFFNSNLYADVIFLDSSHVEPWTTAETFFWYGRTKKVFLGDDYNGTYSKTWARPMSVKSAVDQLCKYYNKDVVFGPEKQVYYIEK